MKRLYLLPVLLSLYLISCEKRMTEQELNGYLYLITLNPYVGEFAEVKTFIEKGAEVDYISGRTTNGNTPFLNAAYGISKERGYFGTDNRPDSVQQKEKEANELESVKIVRYLAAKGADIHATDSTQNRRNALHLAATAGRPHMIRALVDLELDIDNPDALNATPLIHAAASGCIEAVKACVEAGADVNAVMNGNRTALDGAHEYNTREVYGMNMVVCKDHDEIIEYLESRGAKRWEELGGL